jgi:hypothetical protein
MVTGLGWTDLRAGLDRLRIEGIHEHTRDPILKFIARNFGDSIFALDTFLGLHPREQLQNAIQAIAETGRNTAASRSGADLAPIEFEVPDVYEVEAHQANVQRLWLRGGTASTWLTNALFEGGTDPLHLEANNAELIDPYTGGSMMGASRLDESLGHRQIHTCDYAYLAHETQRWFGIVSRQRPNSEIDQTLEYRIDGWPSFGFFKFNYSTGRAYRVGSERSHEWGNPNI